MGKDTGIELTKAPTYQMYMLCCTDTIVDEIKAGLPQADIAMSYALAIRSAAAKADEPDWFVINRAIIERWSKTVLERIKRAAWKLAEGKQA